MANKYTDIINILCPNILVMCENQEDYNETVAAFIKDYNSSLIDLHLCSDAQVEYNAMMIDNFTSQKIDKSKISFLMQNARITFAFKLDFIDSYNQIIFTDKCKAETIQLTKNYFRYATVYYRLMRESNTTKFVTRPLYCFELDPAYDDDNLLFVFEETAPEKPVKTVFVDQK